MRFATGIGGYRLLQAEGRRCQAGYRPLAGRVRWAWPVLAAVLLLVVALVTLLPRHPSQAVHQPGSSAAGLKLYGSVPWVKAVSQTDGHSVSVYVAVDGTPNVWCLTELPVWRASAVESDTRITIEVRAYQPADYRLPTTQPGVPLACGAVAHQPVPLLISLPGPIAGRTLVDASTGWSYPSEQAVDLPALTELPAGYLDAGSSPAQAQDQLPGFAEHSYRDGDAILKLIRGPAGSQPSYLGSRMDATGMVLGHPAKVSGTSGDGSYRCAAWSDRSHSWQLCSTGFSFHAPARLSAVELLALANSTH